MDLDLLTRTFRSHVADIAQRYLTLMTKVGKDAIVIHSGTAKKRSEFDDQYWNLRPTPHFQHWLPLAEADCALVIEPGKTPKLIWTKSTSIWEQPPQPETLHFVDAFTIVEITDPAQIKDHLPSNLSRASFVGDESRGIEWGFAKEQINAREILGQLDLLRSKKTEYEVLCLDEANRRAGVGHQALKNEFFSGNKSELELHLLYLAVTSQDDPETPYKNIVALGSNAAVLHHVSYGRRPLAPPHCDSLLVDAGAVYQGYCSDVTRTWVKGNGVVETTFGGLVAGVEAMQVDLCNKVALGLPYEELHEDAHRQVGSILKSIGVIKSSLDEIEGRKISRAFFPHGLGHSLGLQCHDVGCALIKPKDDNPYLRNTSIIAEGQCFTIEPGIYFIPRLLETLKTSQETSQAIDWKLVDELAMLGGVRIEDDLVVTSGARVTNNLTRAYLP